MMRAVALVSSLFLPAAALAADHPLWGADASRNMVSDERRLPARFTPGAARPGSEEIDPATTKGVRWTAKLGSQSYGNPTIAGGRVFLGTNNESPRDPRLTGDRSVVMALDEKTGALLWQLAVPKLGSGKVNDWEFLGICSSPAVDGDRVYVVTNRGEVLALDVAGLTNGNDGYVDEAKYLGGPGAPPIEPGPTDADIVWRYDLREELGVFPHNATSSAVLVVGDRLYVTTSNGVDWGHLNVPSPLAPALVVLDKKTGALLGEESSGISAATLHSNWSSPSLAIVGKSQQILFGGGDGILHAFAPDPVEDAEGLSVLQEIWRADGNPPEYRVKDGKKLRYPAWDGPSEFISTPVFAGGRVYAAIGQDPEHGSGKGYLQAFDPARTGDQSGKAVWRYDRLGRSISTPAVAGGLLYIADFDGKVHCLEAKTGKLVWMHDTRAHVWGSTLVADGKVYVGNEDGVLTVLAAGRRKKLLAEVELRSPVHGTPVAANGVLYVMTNTHLYAVSSEAR
jgi:outer membrane protein assembly factor BamB